MRFLVTGLLVAVLTAPSLADDYLTKDGKLTNKLEIRDVQGGFAGFTGRLYTIEPSGEFTLSQILPRDRLEVEKKGTLTKDEVATLAKELAKYNLTNLKGEGKVTVNPHVVTIKFGKTEATLNLGAGEPLPKPDAEKIGGRFGGITKAVYDVLKEKKGEKGNDK